MRAPTFALLIVAITLLSCGEEKLIPPKPVVGNDVVFMATPSFVMDLYATNADGTGLHRLTADSLYDYQPRWSPDGTKIAFIHQNSSTSDSANVTVMDADGANRTRLTFRYHVEYPSWSPDGSQISFQNGPGQRNQLWVMNADGSGAHVFIDQDSLNGAWELSWTPQNTFIGIDGFGLIRFDSDGRNRQQIIALDNFGDAQPRMSPDGSKIAFAWTGPSIGGYPYNIYVVNADGSGLKQLTDVQNSAAFPVWSPDGSRIAYARDGFTIWTMRADGSDQRQVTLPSDWNPPYYDLQLGGWK